MPSPPVGAVIQVRDLRVVLGKLCVLRDVSMTLDHGVSTLLGRNGAGKTTLARCLAGVQAVTDGRVVLDGTPVDLGSREHRGWMGWVPQQVGPFGRLRAVDFLQYLGWLKDVPKAQLAEEIDRVAEQLDVAGVLHRRMDQLSGGTAQRVVIAQALLGRPRLIVLDEPTVGLDPEQRHALHQAVKRVAVEARVLVLTHLLDDVAALAESVVVLDGGRVAFEGTVADYEGRGSGADRLDRLRTAFSSVAPARGR